MATTTTDYYRVLGVDRSAGQDEIQRAYRKLARRFHPDINKEPAAEDRIKDINEAYEVLSDPKKRARYDRYGAQWRQIPEDYDGPMPGADPFAGGGRRVARPRSGKCANEPRTPTVRSVRRASGSERASRANEPDRAKAVATIDVNSTALAGV